MSAQTMIRATGVSKQYRLGGPVRRSNSLRESIVESLQRRRKAAAEEQDTLFWALDNVSFELGRGEVLGLIGRNGAGKSTLLKVLSRITEPTAGRIELHGRIASLLEVGTGFHPELTGRENVYLNGTILGMRKREIDRKFDEIVSFAEVERFIDTPVKRYSSGMYVRLAFAVAAHLEPEILVVDEVLAVGDAEFQKKCLGKISDVAHAGRTVLFVSHNMAAMRGLCPRALLLSRGRVVLDGGTEDVIAEYLSTMSAGIRSCDEWVVRSRGDRVVIDAVELLVDGSPTTAVQSGDPCSIRLHYRVLDATMVGEELSVSIILVSDGQRLVNLWTNYRDNRGLPLQPEGWIECKIPRWPFRAHTVRVGVYTHIGSTTQDWLEDVLSFNSFDGDYYRSGVITNPGQGILFLDQVWSHHAIQ
jgi:homopolymeric O-antigen transport system ATP-binding protein